LPTPELYIGAVGTWVPETVTIEEAAGQGLYPAEDIAIHKLGGVAVAGTTPAPEMARRAAVEALDRWAMPHDAPDLLLYTSTWHQGPDGWLPHSYLQHHVVGGRATVAEVRLGCNGVLGAMELAAGFLRIDEDRTSALIVAADNYGTPLMNRWQVGGGGFLPGDAASAIVLTTQPGFARVLSICSTSIPEAEALHRGDEPLFPPTVTLGRSLDFAGRFRSKTAASEEVQAGFDRSRGEFVDIVGRSLVEAGITHDDITKVAYITYSRELVEGACMTPARPADGALHLGLRPHHRPLRRERPVAGTRSRARDGRAGPRRPHAPHRHGARHPSGVRGGRDPRDAVVARQQRRRG
jgi:3-oxoacyl-[acyl-carrier-protein] synthase-3